MDEAAIAWAHACARTIARKRREQARALDATRLARRVARDYTLRAARPLERTVDQAYRGAEHVERKRRYAEHRLKDCPLAQFAEREDLFLTDI